MPYTPDKPIDPPPAAELRARIPGWGADIDPADRPAFPREQSLSTGAHWVRPEQQPGGAGRERSVEHLELTPAFGTAQPLHGVSGAIRRLAYDRFSEGRAAHWLLLVAGDRVEAAGAHLTSLFSGRPDDPVTETGVLGEWRRGPVRSRRGRVDMRHAWIDPLLVAGPWVLTALVGIAIGRRTVGGRRR